MSQAFLTGATGFLGRRVARDLVARGWRVHALARQGSDRSVLAGLPVVWHEGDLANDASLRKALASAHEFANGDPLDVVHMAALISYRTGDTKLARQVNVDGTRRLLSASMAFGVRRFLHTSSIVAVGFAEGDAVSTEDQAFNGARLGVDYVDTKRESEEQALAAASELDVVVVNPGAIFGPASQSSNSAYFLRKAAAGKVRVAPPGGVAVLGVDDAADGVVLALTRGRRGRRYLLCESNYRLKELLALVAQLARAAPPVCAVPTPAWKLLCRGVDLIDRSKPQDRLTPQSMRMIGVHWRADAQRAREELGWKPRPFPEVLESALREMGLLDVPPRTTAATP
ncbi:MAG: NAD-dependent epimerase/dehydratase family protein [Planctomycetes bacterium]|nr:NAD-dependent epimerase/dehydratase family protein [Planctomycetota bacterium]MCB9903417.1 NAD-dependent epimerase/dehydratase family protein [Planctomycetota bacterium]